MIQKRPFMFPVYKDQTVGANAGKLIEVGDTVTVLVDNHNGTQTPRDLTVVGVEDSAKSILYDTTDEKNFRVEDIVRVHAKHEWNCPAPVNYELTLTSTSTTLPISFTSIVVNGLVRPIGVAESAGGTALSPEFAQAVADALNGLLAGNGYASVKTNSAEVAVIRISGSPFVFSAPAVVNGTGTVAVAP